MKLSTLIQKTEAAKAATKAAAIKNCYNTVLNILQNDLQGAEMFPGGTLKLNVADYCGDKFDAAIKSIGKDTLKVCGITLWRSTISRGVIGIDGIDPYNIDEAWDNLIEEIKDRVEML